MIWTLLLLACNPSATDSGTDPDVDSEGTEVPAEPTATFTVATLNVEGQDSEAATVGEVVVAPVRGEALWALQEVPNTAYVRDLAAIAADDGGSFAYEVGTTGGFIKLALMWDEAQLDLLESWEIHTLNIGDTGRAPLVGHFRVVEDGSELLVVVNHLWRTEDRYRHEQATGLNAWALEQELPAITLGDFNFDWELEGDGRDQGYDLLTANNVWEWVVPDELIMTQCNFSYVSILDFVFTTGEATDWAVRAEILNPQHSYCRDDETRTDHRAVTADFAIYAD